MDFPWPINFVPPPCHLRVLRQINADKVTSATIAFFKEARMLAVVRGHAAGPECAQDYAPPGQANGTQSVRLSDADIADLAQAMCIPEEVFRLVIDRYPDLSRVLVSRFKDPRYSAYPPVAPSSTQKDP
jgi:hypothetical protein